MYIWIVAIFAKLNGIGLENYRENSHCFTGINILLIWLCTKYLYYLPFEALVYVSAVLFRSMAYFYSLLSSGENLEFLDLTNTPNLVFCMPFQKP